MKKYTVNAFRKRRGKLLKKKITQVADQLGRDIHILDIGGRAEYWQNVDPQNVSKITVLNYDPDELVEPGASGALGGLIEYGIGDARDLSQYGDGAFDFVHSNSVIEHVGGWGDMAAMAREVRRVGQSGWHQTPAYGFPIEPHFRLPAVHWFGTPTRASLIWLSRNYRHLDHAARRLHAERINLLSRREMSILFPDANIWTERVILAKSYVAIW